jgi:hypothetical protein
MLLIIYNMLLFDLSQKILYVGILNLPQNDFL